MTATISLDEWTGLALTLLRLRLGLLRLRRDLMVRQQRGALTAKYRPDQPRVPAGNPDSGQWTDGSGGSGPMSFEQWLAGGWADAGAADADWAVGEGLGEWRLPDDEARIEPVSGRARGGGPWPGGGSPGQQARLAAAEVQAQAAIRRVQEIDSNWRPPASMSEGIEGAILSNQAALRHAEARFRQLQGMGLGPGPFAAESIPATRPGTARGSERDEIDRVGRMFGRHTCGTTDPGTPNGLFIGDHQKTTALNTIGFTQRLFPHCRSCSNAQGGYIRSFKRGL